jgi:TonB family protein
MMRSTLPLVVLALLLGGVAGAEPDSEAPAEAAAVARFVPPQIILGSQERPVFPPAAWDARFTGSVLLAMTVTRDGAVGEVTILECTRPKVGFEEAALAAVRQWRFEPALEDGQAIEVTTRIRLNFTRVGVGLQAKPQVSAGSFSVDSQSLQPGGEATSTQPSPAAGDRK